MLMRKDNNRTSHNIEYSVKELT